MHKKVIGIICNCKELFLSLKRALSLYFPNAAFYFYDTNVNQFNAVSISEEKEEGVLIAFFTIDEENQKVCQFIKYLRIRGGLRFPLIFCSFSSGEALQNRYDILTYGKNSHHYCSIPIELSMLVKSISSVNAMSDGIFELFCKEYSEKHKEFYEKRVIPLLRQFNDMAKKDFMERLEGLISELINNTPLTCHGIIWYNGKEETLSAHLNSEMVRFKSSNETLQPKILAGIRKLLKQWYGLVRDKTFE